MKTKLTHKELVQKLKKLMLIDSDGKPVLYTVFKNRASIHRYGKKLKVVYIGHPKMNLFGFYVMFDNDSNVMKEAYGMFLKLVKGDMTDYEDGDIQWGNCGIPVTYGNLRSI